MKKTLNFKNMKRVIVNCPSKKDIRTLLNKLRDKKVLKLVIIGTLVLVVTLTTVIVFKDTAVADVLTSLTIDGNMFDGNIIEGAKFDILPQIKESIIEGAKFN